MNLLALQIKNMIKYCNNITNIVPPIKIKYNNNHNIIDNKYHKNKIIFTQTDTLKTALQNINYNPLVLIFADEYNPGGTLVSNCQEETLFRRTALYKYLTKDLYPIENDELILVRNVDIIDDNINESFITKHSAISKLDFIALPCVRSYTDPTQIELKQKLTHKIELIFQTCEKYNYNCVILGAMGSGAFGCSAKEIAIIMKDIIDKYSYLNMTVIISILGKSYNIYRDIFSKN